MKNNNDSYYRNSRSELSFLIPRGVKKIMEIGCGEAAFRMHFSDEVEYVGVEPNVNSAKVAATICDKVLVGLFENIQGELSENYFDLVIANDVIEHSVDHSNFMHLIYSKLNSDSYFLGSVPNVRSFELIYNLLLRKDWKYTESGILDYTHLRYFTKLSLERALNDAGFVNILVTPINRIKPVGKLKKFKSIIIAGVGSLFGNDIGYAQLAFSCKKVSQ